MTKHNSIRLFLSGLSGRRKAAAIVLAMLLGAVATDSMFVGETLSSSDTSSMNSEENPFNDVEEMLAEFEQVPANEIRHGQHKPPEDAIVNNQGTATASATMTIPGATIQTPPAQSVSYSNTPRNHLSNGSQQIQSGTLSSHSTVDKTQQPEDSVVAKHPRIRLKGTIVTTP